MQASDKAAKDQVQHLLVLLTPDGNLQINGATNFVNSLNNNEDLHRHLQTTLLDNIQREGIITSAQVLNYPLLPCSPFSPNWKGSAMIRSVLTKMLVRIGYGDGGGKNKKMGIGEPPVGWPDHISWQDFSGATRSKLTMNEVTEIILSLLRAAHINPDTHVIPPTPVPNIIVENVEDAPEELQQVETQEENKDQGHNMEVNDNFELEGESISLNSAECVVYDDQQNSYVIQEISIHSDVKQVDQSTFATEKGGLESNDNVEMLGMIAHDKIEDNIAGEGDIDESVDDTNGKKRRIGIVLNICHQ